MNRARRAITLSILIISAVTVIALVSCRNKAMTGKILITRVHNVSLKADFIAGTSWRFPEEAQIVALDGDHRNKSIKVLTDGFYSACWPDVSYDGKSMLFAGKEKKDDQWRIWEMNLSNLKARAVSPGSGESTDPVYLPAGRFAFTMAVPKDSLLAGHSIYTCNLDGTDLRRITFNPAAFFALNTLADGRIIAAGRRIYPDTGAQRLMVLRPDGTKAELFCLPDGGGTVCSRSRETADGRVLFIESPSGNASDGKLASVNYNRPLHTHDFLSTETGGSFISVSEPKAGNWLVCYRKSAKEQYGLFEFDGQKKTMGNSLYEDKDYSVLDAVEVGPHERPKKLPSEVDMHVKSGLLMCQNINVLNPQDKKANSHKAVRIEILGIGKSLGVVDVEPDGSFQIKPLSDTPFRIRTLDENGKTVNGPCSWIYLRPNERRGCVGCHEDMELTPENRIALAVKKKPVIVPVHVVKIKEKKVDLE